MNTMAKPRSRSMLSRRTRPTAGDNSIEAVVPRVVASTPARASRTPSMQCLPVDCRNRPLILDSPDGFGALPPATGICFQGKRLLEQGATEQRVKVGIRVFAKCLKALRHGGRIQMGNPGYGPYGKPRRLVD